MQRFWERKHVSGRPRGTVASTPGALVAQSAHHGAVFQAGCALTAAAATETSSKVPFSSCSTHGHDGRQTAKGKTALRDLHCLTTETIAATVMLIGIQKGSLRSSVSDSWSSFLPSETSSPLI